MARKPNPSFREKVRDLCNVVRQQQALLGGPAQDVARLVADVEACLDNGEE
jgi:hypothetical protein